MERADLEQVQIERLQSTLNRVTRNVAFYKQSFDSHGVSVDRIKSLRDLKELPFTTKDDLRRSYPYDMFAVPLKDIVRIHSSSGTTGRPIVTGYTRNDLNHWSEAVARLLVAAGVTEHDFVQVAFDYGLFTGGFGFHYGAERIGASVIPSSSGSNVQKQVLIMKDYKTSVLVSTPGYTLSIINALEEKSIKSEDLRLKIGVFGAEPWSEKIRRTLQEKLPIQAYDTYGLSELMGPGVSGECERKDGLHINEDMFIAEIIDPRTAEVLPQGAEGELVITNIAKEGCPLIRYRTGDLASLIPGPCACGRTFARMSRVFHRTDDMIIWSGAKVLPSQIEAILAEAEGVEPNYRIVLDNAGNQDSFEVQVEVSENISFDEIKKLQEMKASIASRIKEDLGIPAKVTLVERRTLVSTSGSKIQKVVDNRK